MGQRPSQERAHQKNHGRRHPKLCAGDHGHQRVDHVHLMPERKEKDPGHQAAVFGHDHQKCKTPVACVHLFKYPLVGRWQSVPRSIVAHPCVHTCSL